MAANAVADDVRSADRPRAAPATWSRAPASTPSIETSPARRPPSRLRATMKTTEGPGMRIRTALAAAKTSSVERSITRQA
jgi:hypothetical protein